LIQVGKHNLRQRIRKSNASTGLHKNRLSMDFNDRELKNNDSGLKDTRETIKFDEK
jgi:hypothetical protein